MVTHKRLFVSKAYTTDRELSNLFNHPQVNLIQDPLDLKVQTEQLSYENKTEASKDNYSRLVAKVIKLEFNIDSTEAQKI